MKTKKILSGIVKRHPDGFGFLIPDDKEHPDVYVGKHSMKGILTNDRVMVEVLPERGGERFRGEVLQVLQRGTQKVIGRVFFHNQKTAIVYDDANAWGGAIYIPFSESQDVLFNEGDIVVVEIVQYLGEFQDYEGKIISNLGSQFTPLSDVQRILHMHQIPHEFGERVLQQSRNYPKEVTREHTRGRRDLSDFPFCTIDGATAKDFDDAVLTESTGEGFHLFVAIADVSHYVGVGSAIDQEAYKRGTSVYFPNFVIPMLPEVLSNELCSLKPKVQRLALVAEMKFDFYGELLHSSFYEAVIVSHARVTYGEAQEILEGQNSLMPREVQKNILKSSDLAKILMKKRKREGSLDLEIPEVEMEIDASGNPIDIIRSERLFAHKLIEELMLAANVAVAKFLSSCQVPCLYRVHEPPSEEALSMLERYLYNFGGKKFSIGKDKAHGIQKKITEALQFFEGKPEAQILNILTLRSMNQAKYSPNNLGHFGLGFPFYLHFTSPIRRYPDLIVHRLVKNRIGHTHTYHLLAEEALQTAGTILSACEQRAVKAERNFYTIKKARFMEQHIGKSFMGVVSSVTRFGVFVLLREFEVDGLIRLEDLGRDRFIFDEDRLVLYGKQSGVRFSIGSSLQIVVASVDLEAGQINFVLNREDLEAHLNLGAKLEKGIRSRSKKKKKVRSMESKNEKVHDHMKHHSGTKKKEIRKNKSRMNKSMKSKSFHKGQKNKNSR